MDEIDDELEKERADSDRLAAALRTLVAHLNKNDGTLHVVIAPVAAQLTVGHVVEGALALHDQLIKGRRA